VARKLGNFQALDPSVPGGLEHGSAGDAEIWAEFGRDHDGLRRAAATIRAALARGDEIAYIGADDPDSEEAVEGSIVTRLHRARERNRRLVDRKKARVKSATGALRCEACGFDFEATYGPLGASYIECHHIQPLSQLAKERRTRLADLALLCANCHRMIHRRRPWLTLEQLRQVLGGRS
jgi:5-methylcytosine-specific restriction protein A